MHGINFDGIPSIRYAGNEWKPNCTLAFNRKQRSFGSDKKAPRFYSGSNGHRPKKGRVISETVEHFVWMSKFRDDPEVIKQLEVKTVNRNAHEAWHEWCSIFQDPHPRDAFRHIIDRCLGKVKCTRIEKHLLYVMTGLDWRRRPARAIVCIFEKFMPDELVDLVIPYLPNRLGEF